MKMKLLVLVGSSRGFPYDEFLDNWRQVKLPSNVKVYYYFHVEGITDIELHGDELHIPGVETLYQVHAKTMKSYKWALANEEFDVLLRPGLSSAFRFPQLLEWLSAQPKTNHAFGRMCWGTFLSGCGYALTRDVVERIIEYSPKRVIEDDLILFDFIGDSRFGDSKIQIIEWELDFDRPVDADIYSDTNFHLRFNTTNVPSNRAADVANHLKAIKFWNQQDAVICDSNSCDSKV